MAYILLDLTHSNPGHCTVWLTILQSSFKGKDAKQCLILPGIYYLLHRSPLDKVFIYLSIQKYSADFVQALSRVSILDWDVSLEKKNPCACSVLGCVHKLLAKISPCCSLSPLDLLQSHNVWLLGKEDLLPPACNKLKSDKDSFLIMPFFWKMILWRQEFVHAHIIRYWQFQKLFHVWKYPWPCRPGKER